MEYGIDGICSSNAMVLSASVLFQLRRVEVFYIENW